jgi:hypothetical protein
MRSASFILTGLLLVQGLVPAGGARAGDTVVVENPDRGLWDDTPGKTFHLLEELLLGSEDGDDAFGTIAGVVVDSRGRIIVLDRGYEVVKVYDPEAMTMESFGRKGEGPGEFNLPTAVGIDAEDRIYVSSRARVAVFSPSGELVGEFRHKFPGSAPAWSIRVGAGGVYVASLDPIDHKIVHRYSRAFEYLSSFSDSHAVVKPMDPSEEFAFCSGAIDLDAAGNVYFTQSTPYEIRKFSADGRLIMTIHRENGFMQPPRVERQGDRATFHSYAGSANIIVLPSGEIMNVVMTPPPKEDAPPATILDLFDGEGRLLKSRRLVGRISVRCVDRDHHLYAVEAREYPVVVRYELRMP